MVLTVASGAFAYVLVRGYGAEGVQLLPAFVLTIGAAQLLNRRERRLRKRSRR